MSANTQSAGATARGLTYDRRKDHPIDLQIARYGESMVVHCSGRIVYRGQAGVLSEKIADLLPHTRHLVLELSQVEMIDSAGLGELVVLLMWVQASGCSMRLAAPRRHILELLELTNLASVFEIYSSVEAALSSRLPAVNATEGKGGFRPGGGARPA